jgi:hypothetical protein
MKKHFLFVTITTLTLSVNMFSAQNIIQKLKLDGRQFLGLISNYDQLFSGASQYQEFDTWKNTFNDEGINFVSRNNADLRSTPDPVLVNAKNTIKQSNDFMLDLVKRAPEIKHDSQLIQIQKALDAIKTNLNNAVIALNKATFLLTNKKESRSILITMKEVLIPIIDKLISTLEKRKGMIGFKA